MSITSVKSGATGISLALDNNFMEPIATTLVGSGGANTVIFNDIPQNYKHLQIRGIARASYASAITYGGIQFNGDTGANYAWHDLYGQGASAGVDGYSGLTNLGGAGLWAGTTNANIYGAFIIDILDYTNTNKYKTVRTLNGIEQNTNDSNGQVRFFSGLWMNTDAITSIKLYERLYSANIAQYSRFSLYGIKG